MAKKSTDKKSKDTTPPTAKATRLPLTAKATVRAQAARAIRDKVPRAAHSAWEPPADRADPVSILTGQDAARLQWLVPVRHERMSESSFSFFRGGAAIMAADLAHTPTTGLHTQVCGDAHLANFGTYASPERRQVFDVNDFDETLTGPWEWDLKRLVTSFVLAGKDNGFPNEVGRDAAVAAAASYRRAMTDMAHLGAMDVWYYSIDMTRLKTVMPSKASKKEFDKSLAKARSKTSQRALGKLTETVDGKLQIRNDPPLLERLTDLSKKVPQSDTDDLNQAVRGSFAQYAASLSDSRRELLGRFEVVDIALKVVGVGSVGTRCMIVLLTGVDNGEPLILQIKEAMSSVLEEYLPASSYPHHGQRVVEGRRLMQASSDIFLGWSSIQVPGKKDQMSEFYWRQFHDMKGSADVAAMTPDQLTGYANLCGGTLAHSHARAGDSIAIAAYLGDSDTFDNALGDFAVAYAAQNDEDYAAFTEAITSGRIEAADPVQ
ncbi:MAG: DUF2252 domain-containing protein [Actinomycetota bacterium]|nr:DUF2252 domain-containing protein [Actinomycetota bacterium]MDH4015874.1 DUF2252 domain-containing protein [Actinomycetota bacterium]